MTVGLCAASFLYFYFSTQLSDNHFFLKSLLIFCAFYSLMILPTSYVNADADTAVTFIKLTMWSFRLFAAYYLFYMVYHWLAKTELWLKWVK